MKRKILIGVLTTCLMLVSNAFGQVSDKMLEAMKGQEVEFKLKNGLLTRALLKKVTSENVVIAYYSGNTTEISKEDIVSLKVTPAYDGYKKNKIKPKDFSIHIKGAVLFQGYLGSFFPDPMPRYKVGMELESGWNGVFALQYGLLYSGILNSGILELGRLSIPLWFKLRFLQNKPFGIYLGPGISANIYLSNGQIAFIGLLGFDFGIGTLFGVQYYINDKIKVFIDFNFFAYFPSFLYEVTIMPGVAFTWGRNTIKTKKKKKTKK